MLFILIGLSVQIGDLWSQLPWVLVAIAIVLVVRAVIVYAITLSLHRIRLRHGHILFWGGLRGGVAVAVALSLPGSLPGRHLILTMTFGVVLFTILVQGLTIETLARRLKLVPNRHVEASSAAARRLEALASGAMAQINLDGSGVSYWESWREAARAA